MILFGVTPCSLVDRYERFRKNTGGTNFSRQRVTPTGIILGWLAGHKWKNDGVLPNHLNYVVIFIAYT